ncbi:hypothetical protein [uncultured Helicobacter sp.]|uniref:hypothetical protein n=1 Tax=uncultured Helicobacter sp. TaxID=175537 RepID=UPI0037506EEB
MPPLLFIESKQSQALDFRQCMRAKIWQWRSEGIASLALAQIAFLTRLHQEIL